MGVKIILDNKNIIGNGFDGVFKINFGDKIEGINITLLILRPEHVAGLWNPKTQIMLI